MQIKLLGALCAVATLGCGGSDGLDPTLAQFVGVWHYDKVTGDAVCHGQLGETTDSLPPTGNKVLDVGVSFPLVDLTTWPLTLDGVNCNFGFDVSGFFATGRAGQECVLAGTDKLTLVNWKLTMTSPSTADEDGMASVDIDNGDGTSTPCDYIVKANLTKVAKD
jgi:hypothetical protein